MGVLVKNGKSYTGTGDLLIQPVIYSDDERCIGVWRDGKPLYQKTISFDDTMFQPDGSGKKITVSIPDVEAIKTSQVFVEHNVILLTYAQGSMYVTYWAIVNNANEVDIVFRYSSDIGSNLHGLFIDSTVILQYTKTTDTAGTAAWVPTGATPIHYSLNEQVIGTWIDGKPLYQRVIYRDDLSIKYSSSSDAKKIDIGSTTNVVRYSGYCMYNPSGNKLSLPAYVERGSNSNSDIGSRIESDGKIMIQPGSDYSNDTYSIKIVCLILEYTKTTD